MGLHSSDASAVERIVDDVYGHQQGVLNTASGALSWTTQSYGAYGAFGAELPTLESGSTLASTRGWRGYRTDPTGFIYMGARYYNATEGRFISPDPFGHAASMDLYSFANGDPVNFVDPTGRGATEGNPSTTVNPLGAVVRGAFRGVGNLLNTSGSHISEIGRQLLGGNLVTATRLAYGLPFSILQGDAFDSQTNIDPTSQHLSINGIGTNVEGRERIAQTVNASFDVSNTNAVVNDSHFWGLGDLIQIIGEEFGAITIPSIRAAATARQMSGNISWIAHSQGTSISAGAFDLLSDTKLSSIDFIGFGGQEFVNGRNTGLKSAHNFSNPGDFVPHISPGNLINRIGKENLQYLPNQDYSGLDRLMFRPHFFGSDYDNYLIDNY